MFFTHIGFRARKNRNKANKNFTSYSARQRLRINSISELFQYGFKRPTPDKDCD